MNVADDPVVAALNEVVRSDSAAAIIGTTLQRVLRQLDASAKLMAWEIISNRMQPSAKTSLAAVAASARACSGARYPIVPTIAPG